ncbi:cellulose-binding domain-containing protein, partial [Micromonospora sp. KC721]|uniref:cellulose-binding domain-containing protein n=1 Tax=Micromonospora sp. KC721 TaxID=2530380 RepID=UPI0010F07B49
MRKASARAFTVLGMATVIAGTAGTAAAVSPGAAATGCRVSYAASSQWQGGFGANITITNLGDPVSSWALTWSFPAGQTVGQAWSAELTQNGPDVTARNVGYNGSIATNGTVSFGFNGAWTGSNPDPTSFALNGVTCTGSTGGSPSASPTSTGNPTPTATPTPTFS